MYIYIYIDVSTCISTYIHACMHAYTTSLYILYILYNYIDVCTYIGMNMCVCACICVYICIYIRTYIHTYIHTYTHVWAVFIAVLLLIQTQMM